MKPKTHNRLPFLYLAHAAIYRATWTFRNFLDVKSPQQKAILRRKIARKGETTELSHDCPFPVLILFQINYLGNLYPASPEKTTRTTPTSQPTLEYSRNNHSYKLSNLLTKFFPAGSDRSHFLLRALSEVLNGKLPGLIHLPGSEALAFLSAENNSASSGDLRLEREEAKREVHLLSHSDLPPLFLFWLFWEARLWDTRRGWNPNWRNPDATGLKSAPALLPSALQASPLLLSSSLLSWGFNTFSSIILTVGLLEISSATLWGLRGTWKWAPKLIPVSF